MCCTLLILMALAMFCFYADCLRTRCIHTCLNHSQCLMGDINSYDVSKEANEYQYESKLEYTKVDAVYKPIRDSQDICREDTKKEANNYKEEDEISTNIAHTIDNLKKVLLEFDKDNGESVCETTKSKCYCRKEVFNFFKAVLKIFEDNPDRINIVEGVKLIQLISDTSYTINAENIHCMLIPSAFLQHIWAIRLQLIKEREMILAGLNVEIIEVREGFERLGQSLITTGDQVDNLITVKEMITLFVGNLETKINNLINNKDLITEEEVNRIHDKSIELINLYMDVQFLRSAYCIRNCSSYTTVTGDDLMRMYDELKNIEKTQRKFLEVFAKPTYKSVAFFALFNPSEYEYINEYMNVKGIHLQNLSSELNNKRFAIRPQKWLGHWAVMSKNPVGTIWSTKTPDDKNSLLFYFISISKVDNIFLIRSVRWPSWYMYMRETAYLKGQDEKKGPKREWKIIHLQDGKYMMCSKKWPCKFIFMKDGPLGEVLAAYGDPGTSGYWDLMPESEIKM